MDHMMSMKDKILSEILEDLSSKEGEKLKPKAAVSVMEVGKPDGASLPHPDEMAGLGKEDDGENDDDLKALLHSYLSQN